MLAVLNFGKINVGTQKSLALFELLESNFKLILTIEDTLFE